jgi:hypothetical protein
MCSQRQVTVISRRSYGTDPSLCQPWEVAIAEKNVVVTHAEDVTEDALQLAENATIAKPSPFTKRMFLLYMVLFPSFLCSCLNGYDGSLMSAINAMPEYYHYYGMSSAGSATGITFAIYNIGGIATVPFGGPINDKLVVSGPCLLVALLLSSELVSRLHP